MKKEKNSVRQVLQTFWEEVGCHKRYFLVVLFFAVLSYGYSVTHQTISIDDLRRDYYLGRQATKLSGSHGDPTSLAPHERLTDLAVVPREKPHTGAAAREQPRDSPVIES